MLALPGSRYNVGMPYKFTWRFRAFDPVRKRWYTARYATDLASIQQRHEQYQILWLDQIVYVEPGGNRGWFDPYRDPPPVKPPKVKPRWKIVGTAT